MDKVNSVLNNVLNSGLNRAPDPSLSDFTPVSDSGGECSLCQGRGLIILQDGESAVPCTCVKQKNVINKFRNAKMSSFMLGCTFERFNSAYYSKNSYENMRGRSYYETAAIAYRIARRFVEEALQGRHPDGIVFTGNVGSGKTFLAACIANALLEKGLETLFMVVPDLLDEIKATYDSSSHLVTEQELLDAARRVEFLVLDDLGAHNYTEWTRNKLYSIINYRLNNFLPTIITTNLDLAELEEYLGDRTTSRIVQLCRVVQLFTDTDIRIQQRREKDKQFTMEKIE